MNYFYPSYIYITYIMSRSYQQQIRKYALKNKENKCPITGINISSSLDAAHIKPDANCNDDEKKITIIYCYYQKIFILYLINIVLQ